MNRVNGGILALLLAFFSSASAESLRFAIDASYQPFEYKNENSEVVGFDIDLARAVCSFLKKQCEFVEMPYEELLVDMHKKPYDAAISALDISEDVEGVLFTNPYYHSQGQFVSWKGKVMSPAQLRGLRVAAEVDTLFLDYLEKPMRRMRAVSYYGYDEAMMDLASGKVDALLADKDVIHTYIARDIEVAKLTNREPNYTLFGKLLEDDEYGSKGFGIAVSESNPELQAQINTAIAALENQGEIKKLIEKWLP